MNVSSCPGNEYLVVKCKKKNNIQEKKKKRKRKRKIKNETLNRNNLS